MSQWTDRISNHPVWEQLKSLGPLIDQAKAKDRIDPESTDGLERIHAVLAFCGKRLAGTDPFTTYPAPLEGIANALRNAAAELQAFLSDSSGSHIVTANAHMDAALVNLNLVCVPLTSEDLIGVNESIISYRRTLEEQLKRGSTASGQLTTETELLRGKLTDLEKEIVAERQRLAQVTSEYQGQFSSAQESRNKDSLAALTAHQEKFGALIAEYTQRLTEQNADFTRQRENAFKQYQEDIAVLNNNYGQAAKSILEEIENHRTQVEKLVGVIGNLGVTSGYVKTANYARRSLWFWQTATVLAMLLVIGLAYKAFLPVVQGTFSWENLAARVFLCITVGVLAAYAAFQADRFFEIERRNRKLALELEAIGPYLAPLPQELQDKFRIDIGDRSFGRDEPGVGRRGDKSPATVFDMAMKNKESRELLRDLIKELAKSIKISVGN